MSLLVYLVPRFSPQPDLIPLQSNFYPQVPASKLLIIAENKEAHVAASQWKQLASSQVTSIINRDRQKKERKEKAIRREGEHVLRAAKNEELRNLEQTKKRTLLCK